jgi:hypothetical protein
MQMIAIVHRDNGEVRQTFAVLDHAIKACNIYRLWGHDVQVIDLWSDDKTVLFD